MCSSASVERKTARSLRTVRNNGVKVLQYMHLHACKITRVSGGLPPPLSSTSEHTRAVTSQRG